MKLKFTLQITLFLSFITFQHFSAYGQACATSERTINPNFAVTTDTSMAANGFSFNGWKGSSSNTGNIYLTTDAITFSENNVTQIISQNMTNMNLLGNGFTITISMAVNRANPSNTAASAIVFAYGNATVGINNPTGSPTNSGPIELNGGATASLTTFPITASTSLVYSTLTMTFPTNVSNNGQLLIAFSAGTNAGDFRIKSFSAKSCPIVFSGNIFDDKDGLNLGGVNNSGTVALPSGQYVNLRNDSTNTIVASSAVTSGAYSISTTGSTGPQPAAGYSLILTTSSSSTSATAPSNWAFTGQAATNGGSNIGTGGTGSVSVASIPTTNATYYYGINAIPTATLVNKGPYNIGQFPLTDVSGYRGIISNDANAAPLSGTDPEDGNLGTNSKFKIIDLLNGTQLYYGTSSTSATLLAPGAIIADYTPSLLRMYSPLSSTGVYFTYQAIDQASTPSATQTYTIYSSYALPVVLSDFIAKSMNNIATLSWKGVTEINFSAYYVETSSDDSNFFDIGKINGKGSGSTYTFQYDLTQPLTYFRLKMVDLDGTVKYSDILSINGNSTKATIVLYPNPVKDAFTISNLPSGDKNIVIVDLNGKLINKFQTSNLTFNTNIANLPSGIYIVRIQVKNGAMQTLKFIKK